MTDKEEAVSYVYKSYMKAEKHLDREMPDSEKRNPSLSKNIIKQLCTKPAILVTGSKGKGSVSYMMSQLLQIKKKVGLMTSPHINDFNERFCVNSDMITDEALIRIVSSLKPEFDVVEEALTEKEFISPMGIQAAIALKFFEESGTDINVFECGKGVKYDDVNNIVHEYAVINTIFEEHTRELGKTIEEIAENKAAVITSNVRCVYVGEQTDKVWQIIRKQAENMQVPIKYFGKDFWCENIKYKQQGMKLDVVCNGRRYIDLMLPLLGEHQAKNLSLAIAVVEDILGEIPKEACKRCLRTLHWPGRLEVLCEEPLVILDACINRKSAENVKAVLKRYSLTSWQFIIGIPDDKDYLGVVETMADMADIFYLVKVDNPHYVFSDIQKRRISEKGYSVRGMLSVQEALRLGLQSGSAICMLGTTALVAQIYKQKDVLFWQCGIKRQE